MEREIIESGIRKGDFTPHFKKCVESIGIDNVVKLCNEAGGKAIYLPTKERLESYVIKRIIQDEYQSGIPFSDLERKYPDIPKTTLCRYIKEISKLKKMG